MPSEPFTLPEISSLLNTEYRTLHTWVKRGLVRPSVQTSKGTGIPNLFNRRDLVATQVLLDLRKAGVSLALMEQAAEKLASDALERPALMLVNGDVDLVRDTAQAMKALEAGGVTLTYNTATAIDTVDSRLAH
jgi:DNA-binding transcriptional MerR regulator